MRAAVTILLACCLTFAAGGDGRAPTSTRNAYRGVLTKVERSPSPNVEQIPLRAHEVFGDEGYERVLPSGDLDASSGQTPDDINAFAELLDALETMQGQFYQIYQGDWPSASDWTGAVMGTHVSATLSSITKHAYYYEKGIAADLAEDTINRYFSQLTVYYFMEEALSIRGQAYDDMLWVVLGWLENIKFMNLHGKLRRAHSHGRRAEDEQAWYGEQFEPAFAHRAHVFYDLAYRAWDKTLCGGGLTWNPRLAPYKNTITNTLFVSASVGMYLYHPGDDNGSPFSVQTAHVEDGDLPRLEPHDPKFLQAAIDGYKWLRTVNLRNDKGLYVDGYHIRNAQRAGLNGTGVCDLRNEMVYTYNQGVLLSGLRGLWESTGHLQYLKDGYELIQDVMGATGWNRSWERDDAGLRTWPVRWYGLGHSGVLEEFCDIWGTCSQDGQTFKGVFFHHLTLFCETLPWKEPLVPNKTYLADPEEAEYHARRCIEYIPWVVHNANAAMKTKDQNGVFGMSWAPRRFRGWRPDLPVGAVDVRNEPETESVDTKRDLHDVNARGRGRTLETQSGGLAVLRALHELKMIYEGKT